MQALGGWQYTIAHRKGQDAFYGGTTAHCAAEVPPFLCFLFSHGSGPVFVLRGADRASAIEMIFTSSRKRMVRRISWMASAIFT